MLLWGSAIEMRFVVDALAYIGIGASAFSRKRLG